MKLLIRVPDPLIEAIDAMVDNYRFKNRTQFIITVLADWISREKHPISSFTLQYAEGQDIPDAEKRLMPIRNETKRKLMADEWEKYKKQDADLLDGNWEDDRAFERMKRFTEEQEQFEKKFNEQRDRLKTEIIAELSEDIVKLLVDKKDILNTSSEKCINRTKDVHKK